MKKLAKYTISHSRSQRPRRMEIRHLFLVFTVLLHACKAHTHERDENIPKSKTAVKNDNARECPEGECNPRERAQRDLEDLARNNDAMSRIRKFEDKLAMNFALLDHDKITGGNITVVVQTFSPSRTKSASSMEIQFNETSNVHVQIPLEKVWNTSKLRGKALAKLTVVVALWEGSVLTLPTNASTGAVLPQNASAVTVSYFREDESQNMIKESLPVSYSVDLRNDFTEIKDLAANKRLQSVKRVCAWFDFSIGTWNDKGCRTTSSSARGVTCECDHTTTFVTLLMLNYTVVIPEEVHAISLTFEIASICCLMLTVLFILVARNGAGIDSTFAPKATGMRSNRTNSQVSLCVSLLCLHLVIVWSDFARDHNDTGCVQATIMTHYFLLSTGFWSLCEGVGIFVKMFPKMTMNVEYRTLTIVQSVLAWGLPLLITIPTAAYGITHDKYLDLAEAYKISLLKSPNSSISTPMYERCWLSVSSGMVWTAVAPIIFVVLANIAILCYITKGVVKMNKKVRTYRVRDFEGSSTQYGCSNGNTFQARDTTPTSYRPSVTPSAGDVMPPDSALRQRRHVKHMISVTRTFAILMPVLSVPWLLGILANIPGASLTFLTAHTVVNGLQGLQIFLLYCVVNKSDWKIVKRKWKNSDIKFILTNRRHRRRDSVMTSSTRVVTEQAKKNFSKVDSNANAYLNVPWNAVPTSQQYDTLSSCRSSTGTINSTQSQQRGGENSIESSPRL